MELIRLDVMSTRALLRKTILLALLLAVAVVGGWYGPQPLRRMRYSAYNCEYDVPTFAPDLCKGVQLGKGGEWKQVVGSFKPSNEFMTLEMQPENALFETDVGVSKIVTLEISVKGYNNLHGNIDDVVTQQTQRRQLTCVSGRQWCDKVQLLHLSWLSYRNYIVTLKITSPDEIDFIGDAILLVGSANSHHTQASCILRWILILMTCEGLRVYKRRIKTLPRAHRSVGLQWIWQLTLLSLLIQVSFLFVVLATSLLLLEYCVWQSDLRAADLVEPDVNLGSRLAKYVVLGCTWLSSSILLAWVRINQANNPTFHYDDVGYATAFEYMALSATLLYLFMAASYALQAKERIAEDAMARRRLVVFLLVGVALASIIVVTLMGGFLPYLAQGEPLVFSRGWLEAALLLSVNIACWTVSYCYLPCDDEVADIAVWDALYKYGRPGDSDDEL